MMITVKETLAGSFKDSVVFLVKFVRVVTALMGCSVEESVNSGVSSLS